MYHIDLNCDMGESFGAYRLGEDERILDYVTSVNIACGYHAGDPANMRITVQQAVAKGVAIGAHPGLPDLIGFGRRNMAVTAQEAYDMVVYQIGALHAFCLAEGTSLRHVKPHGALYNMAARDEALATAIAKAVYDVNPQLVLFALSGSWLVKAGISVGLRTASEVFADRTYQADGSLTPRTQPNAMISDDRAAVDQVVRMVKEGVVVSQQGDVVNIQADTVCIHGDGPHALQFAATIRRVLADNEISVQPM
ncbi:LamB/YcsF family protein [Alicyclobacillus fastidiosus]|uniref:5-oxoprolinase subunit A n=1 Tax=Alicyclobacillus fastidiosus TaxID=392011 RepID=A0ABV5AEA0_9BACL|nr:5-oxoprolinase subunit PxpA [Alicyclobacillus fastidiosus]WEH09829.1 LamB/YcsF family protein [Alicyclobacillus fastidiosus]